MDKKEIKKILENHLKTLSKISDDETNLKDNPLLIYVLTESIKVTSFTLLFFDRI